MRTRTDSSVGGTRPSFFAKASADRPDALVEEARPEATLRPKRCAAFTFIELLAVIATIGILAAILIPSFRSARVAAAKSKTRVQFSEWSAAIEAFRNAYGYYPAFHASALVNPSGQNADLSTLHLFHDVLAARRRDGSALPAYTSSTNAQFPEAQNRKLTAFHAFADSDFTAGLIQDACGNTEIAVLVDRNLDGVIRADGSGADYASLPAVGGRTPSAADFPASGVRAGVIFYAPAPDGVGFVFSWK
jgi:type II secretory pathway pseudopilin PulG